MAIYEVAKNWPREVQLGGLTSQEGCGLHDPIEQCRGVSHHLSMAYGSLCQVETQLMIAEQLSYLDAFVMETLMASIVAARRLLRGLLRSVCETGFHR